MKLNKGTLEYLSKHFGFWVLYGERVEYNITRDCFRFFLVSNRVLESLVSSQSFIEVYKGIGRTNIFTVNDDTPYKSMESSKLEYIIFPILLRKSCASKKYIKMDSPYDNINLDLVWKELLLLLPRIASKLIYIFLLFFRTSKCFCYIQRRVLYSADTESCF